MLAVSNSLHAEPVEETAARAEHAGFDALELLLNPWEAGVAERARRALRRHGLGCAAGVAVMRGDRDLTHPEPYLRDAAVSYLLAVVRMTADLGGRAVTLFPASEGRLEPRDDADAERERCIEALRRCTQVAQDLGVTIALEPVCRFETHFVNRIDQAVELARAAGPGIGVVADTFHMNIEEADWERALRAAQPWLVNLHLADNTRQPPGYGSFPWQRLSEVLDEIQFDGYLVAEFLPPKDPGSREGACRYAQGMSDAAEVLGRCVACRQ
jgi:D-psicose/D-tagatose/L-ribulose 3-epimerase